MTGTNRYGVVSFAVVLWARVAYIGETSAQIPGTCYLSPFKY